MPPKLILLFALSVNETTLPSFAQGRNPGFIFYYFSFPHTHIQIMNNFCQSNHFPLLTKSNSTQAFPSSCLNYLINFIINFLIFMLILLHPVPHCATRLTISNCEQNNSPVQKSLMAFHHNQNKLQNLYHGLQALCDLITACL